MPDVYKLRPEFIAMAKRLGIDIETYHGRDNMHTLHSADIALLMMMAYGLGVERTNDALEKALPNLRTRLQSAAA